MSGGWEPIKTLGTRDHQVSVAWRRNGTRVGRLLAISVGESICNQMGFQKHEKGQRGQRVVIERNRMAGKLRLRLAPKGTRPEEQRHLAWRTKGCTILVPLDDVKVQENKLAQDVVWSIEDGWLIVKWPPWACPMVQVSGGKAA